MSVAFGFSLLIFSLIGGVVLRASCTLLNLLTSRVSTNEPADEVFVDSDFDVPVTLPPPETISASPYAPPLTTSNVPTTPTGAVPEPSLLRATAISTLSYFLCVVFLIGFAWVGPGSFLSAIIVVPGFFITAVAGLTVILSVALPTRPGKALAVATLFVILTTLLFVGIGLLMSFSLFHNMPPA